MTADVSNPSTEIVCISSQPSNIYDISVTREVLKSPRSTFAKDLHPRNIPNMFVHVSVMVLFLQVIEVSAWQLSNILERSVDSVRLISAVNMSLT